MKDQVLIGSSIVQLEPSSFQNPVQPSSVQKNGVNYDTTFIVWWMFGRGELLLRWDKVQVCDRSNNVDHSLDDPELVHEEVEREAALLPKSRATATEHCQVPNTGTYCHEHGIFHTFFLAFMAYLQSFKFLI